MNGPWRSRILVFNLFLALGMLSTVYSYAFTPPEWGGTPVLQNQSGSHGLQASWTHRRITEEELARLTERDPDLSPSVAKAILARLNVRASYYIAEDIQKGQALKIPNDFTAYKYWTPMPRYIADAAHVPKFIVIVKDIPFLGWYERGRLVGDTYICIGKKDGWTDAGLYRVLDKDEDHFSRSYTNAYGQPAPMPWGLRIYEHVWIHAGDITGGYCSHGCINLPLMPAKTVFSWADSKTVVLIVESLRDLDRVFKNNTPNCLVMAKTCPPQHAG